jgi:1,5-anhydro-D-fructose reductase (1,5-anhydro-D-mannitol-forming)
VPLRGGCGARLEVLHLSRWAILGTSSFADHAVAPAILALDGASIAAVLSRDRSRGEAFAARHGARRVYTSYEELLRDEDVDIVYVATPNALHADQVVAAAGAGKHVLCEKPLATSVRDARRALEACRAAGVRLGVNFQARHHRFVPELKQLLAAGRIGEVVTAEVWACPGRFPSLGWRADPRLAGLGAVHNLGVHCYDLLRCLLEVEIVEVTALLDVGRTAALEHVALVLARLSNGALAYVNAGDASAEPSGDLVLRGSEGSVVGRSVTPPGGDLVEVVVTSAAGSAERLTGATDETHLGAVAAFERAVHEGREPDASGLDGLRAAQVVEAVVASAREGRTVQVDLDD